MQTSVEKLVRANPREFRQRLFIECNGRIRRLPDVLDDWQAADFAALDAGWQQAVGVPVTCGPVYRRSWQERPRGHSKSSDCAVMVSWALYASPRPLRIVVAAADKDQARIDLEAIQTLTRVNPQLARVLDIQKNEVRNSATGSTLTVLASDADSSYGLLPDVVVCDELCHWPDTGKGEELFHSLLSSVAKQSKALLLVLTNAGRNWPDSWQAKIAQAAADEPAWHYSKLPAPCASWISDETLEEQQRLLPPSVFARLWLNQWSRGNGDALDEAAIRDSLVLNGPMLERPRGDWSFAAALDLGVSYDRSALVIVGVERNANCIVLARSLTWSAPVNLDDVERAVLQMHAKFRFGKLIYDRSQAIHMVQGFERRNIYCEVMDFSSAKQRSLMASCLLELFNARAVHLYDDEHLTADLRKLNIVDTHWGFKIEAPRDKSSGHCDSGIALSMVLPYARELMHQRARIYSPPRYTEMRRPTSISGLWSLN